MSFRFGALISGPEHRASWAEDVRQRVTELLSACKTEAGDIMLHLHVGGSLGEPAWTGPGKPRRERGAVSFHVGLPRAIQDDQLEVRLLDFASAAVDVTSSVLKGAGREFDELGHRAAIESTSRSLSTLASSEVRRGAFRALEEQYARRQSIRGASPKVYKEPKGQRLMPSFEFAWSSQGELDRLFELEIAVDQALQTASLGHVDGNEIGAESFTLFVEPKHGKTRPALAMAAETIRGFEARP